MYLPFFFDVVTTSGYLLLDERSENGWKRREKGDRGTIGQGHCIGY